MYPSMSSIPTGILAPTLRRRPRPLSQLKETAMSKTQSALDLLAKNPKMTPCAAARAQKLSPSVLYRALAARNKARCPTCGHVIHA